jgi:hypothetical protein
MASVVESLPKTGWVEVDIKVTADVNISACAARQRVNDFLLSDVSYMMHAAAPSACACRTHLLARAGHPFAHFRVMWEKWAPLTWTLKPATCILPIN